jgi:hypothetical protein
VLLKASNQKASKALGALLIGVAALFSPAYAASPNIAVVGAVESASCKARVVTVLGITFVAGDAGTAAAICRSTSSSDVSYVSVSGTTSPDGSVLLKKLTLLSASSYVPGATQVYLKGTISKTLALSGDVFLSGAKISVGTSDLSAGSIIEVLGTQPVLGGAVLPATIQILGSSGDSNAPVVSSSVGSGLTTNSSIGSGLTTNSSIGSGLTIDSSIGSGLTTNSSIGSGLTIDSSIGSGLTIDSSIGSGLTMDSSIGSGLTIDSSIGSGLTMDSSIGSGLTIDSSIGSGLKIDSSIGSGLTIDSSIGSGLTIDSSIGSGLTIDSSIGSGLTIDSSIGSGLTTNSSIGSGLTTNSSIGSGRPSRLSQ